MAHGLKRDGTKNFGDERLGLHFRGKKPPLRAERVQAIVDSKVETPKDIHDLWTLNQGRLSTKRVPKNESLGVFIPSRRTVN